MLLLKKSLKEHRNELNAMSAKLPTYGCEKLEPKKGTFLAHVRRQAIGSKYQKTLAHMQLFHSLY